MTPLPYVSRGGLKLAHALAEFHVDPTGLICADLGASTGGFTDCLLQHGAAKVYAIDTAYGQLAWKLRQDPRVVVIERANALHTDPREPVDLVVADLGWTKQALLIPVALKWLKPEGRIISLIKPHYEAGGHTKGREAILPESEAQEVLNQVLAAIPSLGVEVRATTRSPILGGGKGTGNVEWLAVLSPSSPRSGARQ
jgi:23S rRNA (cytidine1920-2'-O)/16S rRNA (cytidine1409-2'-O)-methyltransferase